MDEDGSCTNAMTANMNCRYCDEEIIEKKGQKVKRKTPQTTTGVTVRSLTIFC